MQTILLLLLIQYHVIRLLIFNIIFHYLILPIFYRGIDVENAIKLAAADDGFVTYDELRENLRK